MKKYEAPMLEFTALEIPDIITSSDVTVDIDRGVWGDTAASEAAFYET